MGQEKRIVQLLIEVTTELQGVCGAVKQNTVLDKNNAILLKRYTEKLRGLLIEKGIETVPDLIEENSLLIQQNEILIEQRETDIKSLARLQAKLDELQATAQAA